MTRALVRLAVGALAVGVTAWLVPASVHIVSWPASGPVRVAMLAPLKILAVAGTAAILVAVAVWAWARRDQATLARAEGVAGALSILWLWVVPYLPWLPDRAPLLLVFAGPLRWVIAAVAVGRAVWIARGRPTLYVLASPRLVRIGILIGSFVLYAALGLRSATTVGFGGDEPHYLVITHSLLVDHDLDIANNHAQRDYRAFYPGDLRPDYLRRGVRGEIYSIHAPGLPVLLLPAYAVAGARGAVLTIAAMAAATALAVFDAALLVAGVPAAVVTSLAVCLAVPFMPHSWLIYPEMPGALIIAWAIVWLCAPLPSHRSAWVARGAALAVLPWLHTKFVVLLVMLAASLLWRLRSRLVDSVALLAPIAVSGAAWLFAFYRMYGKLDPEAPYGSYTDTHVLLENIPRGVLGLFFDQKFGLIVYAPVYLFAIAGAWLMLRDRDRRLLALELLSAAAIFVASTTRLYMWWGGASAPARFLVPTLPMLAPLIAVAAARSRSAISLVALRTLAAAGVAIAAFGLVSPRRLFSTPHGYSSLLGAIQNSAPLVQSLPTFTEENWHTPLGLLGLWVVAGGIMCVAVALLSRRKAMQPFAAVVCGAAGLVVGPAVVLGGRVVQPPARMAVAQAGAMAVADAYDPGRVRGFDYARGRRLTDSELLALAMIVAERAVPAAATPRPLDGPFLLPPGRYEARVWMDAQFAREGDAVVAVGPGIGIARTPLAQNPTEMTFELPIAAGVSVGVGTDALARGLRRVEIVPASLVPRGRRRYPDVHDTGPVEGRRQAFAAYVDGRTRPEGPTFWTRGTTPSLVVVATAGATMMRLTLRAGPEGSRVGVDVGGDSRTVDLGRDEIQTIEFPLRAGEDLMPVRVVSSTAFRPADVDPHSADTRLLGCQARLELR